MVIKAATILRLLGILGYFKFSRNNVSIRGHFSITYFEDAANLTILKWLNVPLFCIINA